MNRALKDYKHGKIAKEYSLIKVNDKKDNVVWCADNIFKEYWDKLKKKAKK